MFCAILAALVALSTPCTNSSRPWIAELLYDAVGDDTGQEFVELLWEGEAPYPLAGAKLESGDGSAAGRWTTRWTGGALDSIRPGARFVIGGSLVAPPPDAVVTLDLQNGPDAVRLVWPDGASEVLGFGVHEFVEYFCGEPATDIASGLSLARTPDDARRGSNALDFAAATPSPGHANVARRDAALRAGALRLEPMPLSPLASAVVTIVALNSGLESLAPGEVRVTLGARADGAAAEAGLAGIAVEAALAPGDSASSTLAFVAPAAGKWTLIARALVAGDERHANDADSARVRLGPGPLGITEIQFHPSDGGGEWIELRAREGLDLQSVRLADRGGTAARVAGPAWLAAESLTVWCQSRELFLARRANLDTSRVFQASPWPALNNTDDANGIADELVVIEADGTPADRVAYSATGVPPGVPIELAEGVWRPALDPGGSPLSPPRSPPQPLRRFGLASRRIPEGGTARFAWALPFSRATIRVTAYDLAGRRVAGVLAEFAAGPRGERDVALASLPPGLYSLAVEARGVLDEPPVFEAHAVRILRSAP
jgi:hypothetical protein